jgi:disulfide oxidoreductase YuzD
MGEKFNNDLFVFATPEYNEVSYDNKLKPELVELLKTLVPKDSWLLNKNTFSIGDEQPQDYFGEHLEKFTVRNVDAKVSAEKFKYRYIKINNNIWEEKRTQEWHEKFQGILFPKFLVKSSYIYDQAEEDEDVYIDPSDYQAWPCEITIEDEKITAEEIYQKMNEEFPGWSIIIC